MLSRPKPKTLAKTPTQYIREIDGVLREHAPELRNELYSDNSFQRWMQQMYIGYFSTDPQIIENIDENKRQMATSCVTLLRQLSGVSEGLGTTVAQQGTKAAIDINRGITELDKMQTPEAVSLKTKYSIGGKKRTITYRKNKKHRKTHRMNV
jgi:hypothetical protein